MTRRVGLGMVALALATACGGKNPPTPSNAGDLQVSFFQGSGDVGGMLLSITGGPVEGVSASTSGLLVSFASPAVGTTRVLVTGPIHTGDILKVRVPDTTLSTSYTVHIDQVADNLTFALVDPSAHSATIHQ